MLSTVRHTSFMSATALSFIMNNCSVCMKRTSYEQYAKFCMPNLFYVYLYSWLQLCLPSFLMNELPKFCAKEMGRTLTDELGGEVGHVRDAV